MSRVCSFTNKRPQVGNTRSHARNASKRRFLPNLQVKKVKDPVTGRFVRMKVSTAALRTLTKRGQA